MAPAVVSLQGCAFFARRDDRRGSTINDGIVAFARVVGAIGSHTINLLIARDLVQQMRQHRCIPGVAAGDLDGSDFQRLLVDTDVDLAPDASAWAAMLAGVPLACTLDLDPCAVGQQVQRALRATIRNVHSKRLLTAADGAEVRHGPVQPRQPQETFHKASRLT
jgi:hypothetical protein